jgi:hypothetical protein
MDAIEPGKKKLSGPIVTDNIKRVVGILAQDKGLSVEQYLGDLVTEAIEDKWKEFQRRMATEWTGEKP